MANSTYELIVKAVDKTSGPLRRIEGNLGKLERKSKGITLGMGKITAAITAIATGGALRSIVATTANFEDLNDTLASVTGSAEAGAKAFEFITKFSTQTQFGVEDLTTTFIKLQGAGITPTQKLLTTFTDVAAVTTDQVGTLTAITDLFSRTTSGGLGLEELNRLADRGVPVFKMLEDQLGITRLEISEFGKTSEGARKITEALTRAINQQFGGATEQKLDNLSTAMSNFKIEVGLAANKLGTQFRPQLTKAITEATAFLQTNDELIEALGSGLGSAIVGTAEALKFLAQNFEAIKNAALSVLFIQGAASAINFLKALNPLLGKMNILNLTFAKVGTSIKKVIFALPLVGGGLKTIAGAAVRLGPLLANPFIGIPAAVATALTAGLFLFRDETIKIGGITATLGETTRAVFQLIGGYIKDVADFFGNTFGFVIDEVKGMFSTLGGFVGKAFTTIVGLAKNGLNNILNGFIVTFEYIRGIVFGLPNFFIGAFNGVLSLADSFGDAIARKFSNIFEAVKLAGTGKFTEAYEKLGEDTGFKFGEALQKALDEVPPILPEVDTSAIMASDRLAIMLKPVTDAIEGQIVTNRKAIQVQQLKTLKDLEAAHGAAFLAEQQAKANKETNDAANANSNLTKEIEKRKNASAVLIERLLEEKLQLKDLQAALLNVSDIARLTGLSETELTQALEDQIASLQRNKEAVDENGKAKEKQKTTVDNLIDRIKQENKDLELLKNALADVDKIARANGLSQAELTKALEEQIETLERTGDTANKVGEQTKTFAEEINEAIKKQGDSLANNLARSLAQGKASLGDFKSFLNQTLEDIATMIIQKRITQPFVDSILGSIGGTSGAGSIGNILGSIGSSGGMGNIFGSITSGASSIFSSIGGFFGLANGGIARGNKPYMVGERGPEMFVPNTTGQVVSNEQLGNRGETVVNFNINAIDTQTGMEFLLRNKPQIIGMVSQAHNQRGRQGITS
jgi:DNA-binding phage protein